MYSYYSAIVNSFNNAVTIYNITSELLLTIKKYGIYYGFTIIINGVKVCILMNDYMIKNN